MSRFSRQFLFALLGILMLSQSVSAVAGTYPDASPSDHHLTAGSEGQILCGEAGCCQAEQADIPLCCLASGCDGDCHEYCLCHVSFVTLAMHAPELNLAPAASISQDYLFHPYSHSDPDLQSPLRPPCA